MLYSIETATNIIMNHKRLFLSLALFLGAIGTLSSQNIDFNKKSTLGNLYIRMYGEVHYYQPFNSETYQNGSFDAKRIVALFGYQFNRNTQFVTEWELEHADEIFLEQAFIKHKLTSNNALKAGMILIPMGIINENHEPNNFFSVDRPIIDKNLVPTTWRDIGIGITGLFPDYDLRYQAFLVNGLLSYKDGKGIYNGINNYRSGRQKGSKTIMSGLPAFSGQIEYFGFPSGKLGLSVYSGASNSDAYDGAQRGSEVADFADSTSVYTNMLGLHFKYDFDRSAVKAQVIYAHNSGVDEYNESVSTDLGSSALGMYVEAGYFLNTRKSWLAFGRFSLLDNDFSEDSNLVRVYTGGFNYFPTNGAVFKMEGQWNTQSLSDNIFQINTGIGVWF